MVAVDTGAAALEAMRAKPFDCVVLDLRLPDMSGFELLEKIAQRAVTDRRAGGGVHRQGVEHERSSSNSNRWPRASC